jgi:pimeloyl-ACP methyl ester carboxylesterase
MGLLDIPSSRLGDLLGKSALCGLLAVGGVAVCGMAASANPSQSQQQAEAKMLQTVTSRDGTKISYRKVGTGPAVILVNGALARGDAGAEIAKRLAPRFTVYTYDRRGRGESGDGGTYSVEREVEDIAALIEQAGGTAYLTGFSSGAALALEAASFLGPKVRKLALYEAPYDESQEAAAAWQRYGAEQADLLAAGRREDAVLHHLKFAGVPDAMVAQMKASPEWAKMVALAPTLRYDRAAIGKDRSVPIARAARIGATTLVMDGEASRKIMPFMHATADRIAKAVPKARRQTLKGQGHNVAADAVAPVLIAFFSAN